MTFLEQLRRLFSGNQDAQATASMEAEPATETPTPAQTEALATPSMPKMTDTNAVVLIGYVDEAGTALSDPQWLNGQLGEALHLEFRQFDDYLLADIQGFTTTFDAPYHIMTLHFIKKLGHPAILYPIDYDTGRLVAVPKLLSGPLNVPFLFKTPKIDGYRMIKASRPLTGHFTHEPQVLIALLRQSNWQSVQRVNYYLELNQSTPIYETPAGKARAYEFPSHSVWRAFTKVTLTNGDVWYNLGGPQWLLNDKIVITDRPAQTPIDNDEAVPVGPQFDAVHFEGRIDFVANESVSYYDAPNGLIIGELAHNTPITITGQFEDPAGIMWYRLTHDWVIPAHYVRLKHQPSTSD